MIVRELRPWALIIGEIQPAEELRYQRHSILRINNKRQSLGNGNILDRSGEGDGPDPSHHAVRNMGQKTLRCRFQRNDCTKENQVWQNTLLQLTTLQVAWFAATEQCTEYSIATSGSELGYDLVNLGHSCMIDGQW